MTTGSLFSALPIGDVSRTFAYIVLAFYLVIAVTAIIQSRGKR